MSLVTVNVHYDDVVCVEALNEVQFELEHRQSSLIQSQQTWAGRFDRLDHITTIQPTYLNNLISVQPSFSVVCNF